MRNYDFSFENLRHIYFGNGRITEENITELVDLTGDLYLVEGIQKAVLIQIQKSSSPTYYYQYSYDRGISPFKIFMQTQMSGKIRDILLKLNFPKLSIKYVDTSYYRSFSYRRNVCHV